MYARVHQPAPRMPDEHVRRLDVHLLQESMQRLCGTTEGLLLRIRCALSEPSAVICDDGSNGRNLREDRLPVVEPFTRTRFENNGRLATVPLLATNSG